jgi:RNA polymerase sigma factor (TIGR02999 family)
MLSSSDGYSGKRRPDGARRKIRLIPMNADRPVTDLLLAWGQGDDAALQALTPLVYDELRRLARRSLRGEREGHTLPATALVHEAFVRLVDGSRVRWQDRAHFFAVAARLMRRVLVDFGRARRSQKRGGSAERVSLDEEIAGGGGRIEDLLAVDAALEALARLDPRKAQVVELRFFGGLTVEESAEALSVSPDTIKRDWKFARVWLMRELSTT